MLIHCYILIKCTQTILLPLAIMRKASANWNSTSPSLPPHTCQLSLWFRQIGCFIGWKRSEDSVCSQLTCISHLEDTPFSETSFCPNTRRPFFTIWGHARCYPVGTSVCRSHQVSESFLPFLHMWPLSLLYEMCNPGREVGEASSGNTPSSWPASQWLGPQPRPLTEAVTGSHFSPPNLTFPPALVCDRGNRKKADKKIIFVSQFNGRIDSKCYPRVSWKGWI